MATISIRFDERGLMKDLRRNLMSEEGEIRADTRRRARNVRDAARANARSMMRNPTGKLAQSISFTTVESRGPDTVVAQVGSRLDYALWVHEGTGIYGPTGTPITPSSKRLLVFDSKRASSVIRTYEVQGQKPKPFLEKALQAALV